ncbi:S16 family serine protease [Luxibacter massiliensis]|uniref:S16 family serine protease n=1 Tax=Luxibacter massiliensis TaxID=2219695 RepID=UPI002FE5FC64
MPKDNTSDLKGVSEEIKSQLTIIPISTIEDVLKEMLGIQLPRIEQVIWSGATFGTPMTNIPG